MSLIHKETNYDEYLKTFNSFSGCDMVVTCNIPGYDPFVIGSAQTLSYSIHMARNPVRSIGNINAKDYTLGPRTIAGTLIFAVFDKHVIYEMMKKDEQSNNKRIYADYSSFKNSRHMLMDEMPPFDITISYANEYGHQARLAIYGIRLIDEGKVMSINDIYTENTYQYVATDIDYLNDDDFDKLVEFDSFSNIEEDEEDNEVVYAGIDEQDILMLEVFDNINPSEKTIRLRWKYGNQAIPEGTIYVFHDSIKDTHYDYYTDVYSKQYHFTMNGTYEFFYKSSEQNDDGSPLWTAYCKCIINDPNNGDPVLEKPIVQYIYSDEDGSIKVFASSPNGNYEYINTMIPLYSNLSYTVTDESNNIITTGVGSSINFDITNMSEHQKYMVSLSAPDDVNGSSNLIFTIPYDNVYRKTAIKDILLTDIFNIDTFQENVFQEVIMNNHDEKILTRIVQTLIDYSSYAILLKKYAHLYSGRYIAGIDKIIELIDDVIYIENRYISSLNGYRYEDFLDSKFSSYSYYAGNTQRVGYTFINYPSSSIISPLLYCKLNSDDKKKLKERIMNQFGEVS